MPLLRSNCSDIFSDNKENHCCELRESAVSSYTPYEMSGYYERIARARGILGGVRS